MTMLIFDSQPLRTCHSKRIVSYVTLAYLNNYHFLSTIMSSMQGLPRLYERKKRETIIDLSKFLGQAVRVKFDGGRESEGILKGYDRQMNLVLEDTMEYLRDPKDSYKLSGETRKLGQVICKGNQMVMISPAAGMRVLTNPFDLA